MAAGLLIRDQAGAVLLVKPTYKDGWDIPGGYIEKGESPAAACSRELVEELGMHADVGRLLVVDWAPHPIEGDKVLWVFDGGVIPATVSEHFKLQRDEIAETRSWPPEEFADIMPARLKRRLYLALDALARRTQIYAENGVAREGQ